MALSYPTCRNCGALGTVSPIGCRLCGMPEGANSEATEILPTQVIPATVHLLGQRKTRKAERRLQRHVTRKEIHRSQRRNKLRGSLYAVCALLGAAYFIGQALAFF